MNTPGIAPARPGLEMTLQNTLPIKGQAFARELAAAIETAPAETDNPEVGTDDLTPSEEKQVPNPAGQPPHPTPSHPLTEPSGAADPTPIHPMTEPTEDVAPTPNHPPTEPPEDSGPAPSPPPPESTGAVSPTEPPTEPAHAEQNSAREPNQGTHEQQDPNRNASAFGVDTQAERTHQADRPGRPVFERPSVAEAPRILDPLRLGTTPKNSSGGFDSSSVPTAPPSPATWVASSGPIDTAALTRSAPAAPRGVQADPEGVREAHERFEAFKGITRSRDGRTEVNFEGREGQVTVGLRPEAGEVFLTARLTSRALLEAFDASAQELADALSHHGLDLAGFDTATYEDDRQQTPSSAPPSETGSDSTADEAPGDEWWRRTKIVA